MIKVLVPISGGKDSQASLKLALEYYPADEVMGLFCDTEFEHPDTYAHVEKMRNMYGVKIEVVNDGSVLEKSVKYGRFPGGGARHCTDELKIRPTKIFCKALAEKQGGFEVWYGMRTGESPQRAKRYAGKVCDELYFPHEVIPSKYPKYLGKLGVMFRLCILDWTEEEVIKFCGWDNINPLYHAGFPRVGCFPCLASGDKYKIKAFSHDDFGREQHRKVIEVSLQIGKDIFTSKAGKSGCLICQI